MPFTKEHLLEIMYYAVVVKFSSSISIMYANKLYIVPPTHVYAFTVWCMYTYGACDVMHVTV